MLIYDSFPYNRRDKHVKDSTEYLHRPSNGETDKAETEREEAWERTAISDEKPRQDEIVGDHFLIGRLRSGTKTLRSW